MATWIELSTPCYQALGLCWIIKTENTPPTLLKRGPRNKRTHLTTSYNCQLLLHRTATQGQTLPLRTIVLTLGLLAVNFRDETAECQTKDILKT